MKDDKLNTDRKIYLTELNFVSELGDWLEENARQGHFSTGQRIFHAGVRRGLQTIGVRRVVRHTVNDDEGWKKTSALKAEKKTEKGNVRIRLKSMHPLDAHDKATSRVQPARAPLAVEVLRL